eukprot:TRINITY_DN3180_c0_g1_i5.p1 TRINITY_DN3180_c0_g1~~TRINITY_DN3180_c0_g1_i5.p1  ORF type:complete len:161 (+),score=3.27 TRINITY_DN3180_c0_g1_i5:1155-1637(+)
MHDHCPFRNHLYPHLHLVSFPPHPPSPPIQFTTPKPALYLRPITISHIFLSPSSSTSPIITIQPPLLIITMQPPSPGNHHLKDESLFFFFNLTRAAISPLNYEELEKTEGDISLIYASEWIYHRSAKQQKKCIKKGPGTTTVDSNLLGPFWSTVNLKGLF